MCKMLKNNSYPGGGPPINKVPPTVLIVKKNKEKKSNKTVPPPVAAALTPAPSKVPIESPSSAAPDPASAVSGTGTVVTDSESYMKKVEEDIKLINQSYKEDLEKRLAYMQKKDSVKKSVNKVPVRIFQKDAVNPSITQPVPEKTNLEAEPEKDFFSKYGTGIQAVMWVVYFLFMTIYILNASPIFISTILVLCTTLVINFYPKIKQHLEKISLFVREVWDVFKRIFVQNMTPTALKTVEETKKERLDFAKNDEFFEKGVIKF